MAESKGKVIIALDTNREEQALALVEELLPATPYFKVGLELYNHAGPCLVQRIIDLGGRVFLDLKFHDIPNTVAGASRAAVASGAFMFNVHAQGGREMLTRAATAAGEEAARLGVQRPVLLGVTVLTSLSQEALEELGVVLPLEEQVIKLAKLCWQCGLQGVVASPRETTRLRREMPEDFLIVTPGVRPAGTSLQDQKRVMTPLDALRAGADYLVIGRPVTAAKSPLEALTGIMQSLRV